MNRNYLNGRAKEYRQIEKLKKEGYDICQRMAGSHSPIDVIGISKEKKEIVFIQCKPKKTSDNAVKKIFDECGWLSDNFKCKFGVLR